MGHMEPRPEDLRIDVIRVADGNPCAVRITHLPTGTVVRSADEDSIEGNRERALLLLREALAAR
jgi:protein subunit release factor A